jgi:hypothetical protein
MSIRRKEIKTSNPTMPICEITKLLGAEWNQLSPDQRLKFKLTADEPQKIV